MDTVVTGGAGFIGSHLVDALLARGDRVLVLDDLSGGRREQVSGGAELQVLDIRSPDAFTAIHKRRPRAIFHLAAQMSVSRSVREPVFDADVNLLGSLNLLEAARQVGARFIFASTGGALYGETEVLPTPEGQPAWPVSPYGVGKLGFEHYLHCYRACHGMRATALRYANVFGPRQNPHGEAGVVAVLCRRLLAGEPAVIHGDGEQTRDLVYVADVVEANLAALDSPLDGHFNVGTGRQTTVNELYRALARALDVAIPATHGPVRSGDLRHSALDCRLIGERLGWRPRTTLDEGLAETVAWFRRSLPP